MRKDDWVKPPHFLNFLCNDIVKQTARAGIGLKKKSLGSIIWWVLVMLISNSVRNLADSNIITSFLSELMGVYLILQGPFGCAQERFACLRMSALLCVGCSGKGHREHTQWLEPPLATGAPGAGARQLGDAVKYNRSCCDFRGFYPVRVDERPPLGDVKSSHSHILVN